MASPSPFISSILRTVALALLLSGGPGAGAFSTAPPFSRGSTHRHRNRAARRPFSNDAPARRTPAVRFESADDEASADATTAEAARTRETPKLTSEDKSFVASIHAACSGDAEAMEDAVAAELPNMHPRLVVALQLAAERGGWKEEDPVEGEGDGQEGGIEGFESRMVALGTALRNVLDVRLRSGRETLASLLDSGEIRKLDATIGKAAREGRLDMSFFTVLNMNMKDAATNDKGSTSLSPTLAAGEGQPAMEGDEGQPSTANRLQILQHVYTRAQEELEKNVAPGMGLLNKLLRTEVSSIRANQLEHYLCPQKTSITSPDGKTIELGGTGAPLVGHGEFVAAVENTVTQIRTLEASGGTDHLSAANLVESVRQVAMEARVVLVNGFGEGSDVVREFQRDLQPVFRPGGKVQQ